MSKLLPKGLLIRTGAVRLADVGYILTCDPKLVEDEIPHTITFTWKAGKLIRGDGKFNADSCCVVDKPEAALVKIGGEGYYSVAMKKGLIAGNIFDNSLPIRRETRYGMVSSVATIQGMAYAIGLRGIAYRLDSPSMWTRIDEGLPNTFNGQAIHGFSALDIYAVGQSGQLWHFNGRDWSKRELPVNAHLTSVKCAEDGSVYIAGHAGTLLRGRDNYWDLLAGETATEDLWSLEWFREKLYVASLSGLFVLAGNDLEAVKFGKDVPETTYRLSVADGVMWSIGNRDVLSFDGKVWSRIV